MIHIKLFVMKDRKRFLCMVTRVHLRLLKLVQTYGEIKSVLMNYKLCKSALESESTYLNNTNIMSDPERATNEIEFPIT